MSTPSADGHPPPPLVVVGASAGGVEALRDFVAGLPADLPAAVLVVLHVPPDAPSALPAILSRVCALPVRHAWDGDRLHPGTVVVAQPNRHLMVLGGSVALTSGPQENGHRPAVDVLFRSAARAGGARTVGVVLSGALDDGAAGAVAIASRGGRLIVQDPGEALYPSMPQAAAQAAGSAVPLTVERMGETLAKWLAELPEDEGSSPSALMTKEVDMAEIDAETMHADERPGAPAGFGCPDCAGALFQIEEGNLRRYRCRVGHAWSPESLLARQTAAMESALWMALRSLEERASLNADLGQRAADDGRDRTAARFDEHARETLRAAELVRRLIEEIGSAPEQDIG